MKRKMKLTTMKKISSKQKPLSITFSKNKN